ncbi:hypothetical protein [uncultured Maribacter sp.]|uniref:hypothetical protein n=1 Tax=uncultured Maribacter sp. TaxID=431308 RepID=UPI0026210D0E|nr:hypothetical protein [uncultured Maribacter sp.]
MKMIRLILLIFCITAFNSNAQDIANHTAGLRLGDSDGFGAEISYQHLLSRTNRLELDLGFRDSRGYDAVKLAGLYQWVLPISQGFNWYYGFGGGLGSVDFAPIPSAEDNDGLFVFAAGDIGIEYNFDFPLLLSLDCRPEFGIIGYKGFSDNFDFDVALGIRYQF